MAVTGPGTVLVAVLVCVMSTVLAVVLWNRLGASAIRLHGTVCWLARAWLMLTAQASAVLLVAVLLNPNPPR